MQSYFTSKLLSQIDFIDHAFYGRVGGTSSGVYSTLNTSFKVGDNSDNVEKNRSIITAHFNLPSDKLLTLNQVHSTKIIPVDNSQSFNSTNNIEADGMITSSAGIILGIYTADCIPILFVETTSQHIAAIHCGWKGLLNGIIQTTLAEFKKIFNNNIIMAIGPCIHEKNYVVDENFYKNFSRRDANSRKFFKECKIEKKYTFNLPLYVYSIGIKEGINKNNIDIIDLDTYENEDLFFSHRRSVYKNEARGLQLSCITIRTKD